MAVVGNLSVLLSARTEKYRSGLLVARKDTKTIGQAAKAAGTNFQTMAAALDRVRESNFRNLSAQRQLNEEIRALRFLNESGALTARELAQAERSVQAQFRATAAAAAQAKQKQRELNESRRQAALAAAEAQARSPLRILRDRLAEIARLREQGLGRQTADTLRRQAVSQFGIDSGSTGRARAAQESLNQSIARGVNLARSNRAALQDYQSNIRGLRDALKSGRISQAEFTKARTLERENIREITRGIASNATLEKQAAQVKQSILTPQQLLNQRVDRYRILLQAGKLDQIQFNAAVRQARIELNASRFSLRGFIRQLGILKTVAIGISGALIFSALFNLGAEPARFESQILRTLAIFENVSAEQERIIRRVALRAGSDTSFRASATEAAEALEEIARAGFRQPERALPILKPILQFAQISKLTAQRATELGTDVQAAFGLKVKNAEQNARNLVDTLSVLAQGSLEADTNVEQLSEAMIKAAPQARQLGLSTRQTAAALLALAERGRKGFAGGTELGIVLRDFTRIVRKNADKLEAAGVRVYDGGNFRGLPNVLEDIENGLAGLNDQARGDFVSALGFQDKALRFTQQLIGASDAIRELETKFNDLDGILGRLSRDSLANTFKLLKRIRGVITEILSKAVVPFLENISGHLLSINTRLLKNVVSFSVFVVTLLFLIRNVPKIVAGVIAISKSIRNLVTTIIFAKVIGGGFKGILVVMTSVAAAAGAALYASEKMNDLSESMDEILNKFNQQKEPETDLTSAIENTTTALSDSLKGFESYQNRLAQLRESTRTPIEVLIDNIRELQSLETSDLFLDNTTKRRALLSFLEDYRSAVKGVADESRLLNSAAILRGSQTGFASAFSVRGESARGTAQERQLQEMIESRKTLQEILSVIESQDRREPVEQIVIEDE